MPGVEAEGLDALAAELEGMKGRIRNLLPAAKASALAVENHIAERFDTETDDQGRPWAPLTPKTVKRRKPGKILTQDATLRNSWYARADSEGLTAGSGLVYAAAQNFGTEHIAARAVLTQEGLDNPAPGTPAGELMLEISETYLDFIQGLDDGA